MNKPYEVIGNANELTEEQWKSLRVIGGSTVGAILGLNQYVSPYMVWERLITGEEPEIDNKHIRFGNLLEPVLRQWFAEEIRLLHGEDAIVQENPDVMRSLEYDFLTGNIDGDVFLPEEGWGVIEIKTASAYSKAFDDGEIPDSYYAQLQYYLWLTGRSYGFIVWLKDKELGYQYVGRDDQFINNMIYMVTEFWFEYVEKDIPPPFTGEKSEEELLLERYGVSDPGKIIDMPEMKDTLELLHEVREEIKSLEKTKSALENELKFVMGDAEIMNVGDMQVTWKTGKTGKRRFVV